MSFEKTENENSIDSPHLENYPNTAPQPKLLKEIRETELCRKNTTTQLDDYLNLFSFESDVQFSSELKFLFAHDKENGKEHDRKSLDNLQEMQNMFRLENNQEIAPKKEALKNSNRKSSEHCWGSHNKVNFKYMTQPEKKVDHKKKEKFLFLLSTIFVIRKFVRKLSNLSFLRSPSKLEQAQFNLIGDKTYIQEVNSYLTNEYVADEFDGRHLILDPSKNFSIVLDVVVLIALSYYFFMIPLHLTYHSFAVNSLKVNFDVIAFYILVFDILRAFNTAFYLKGKLEFSRWKIVVEYVQQDFLFDFFSLTPALMFILNIYQNNFEYFLILFYFKIKNFKGIATRLEQLLLTNKKFHHGISLIKLISWIIFITHSFACIWNGIGLMGDEYFETTWLKVKGLNDANSLEQYLFSYYFVCVTMNTVGFGDIAPTNKIEVLFCIVFIFLACGIFAYSINSIGLILTDISKQQDEYRKDLNTINDFMKKKKISFDLRMRIRKYLEYIKKENKMHEPKETGKTINKLSDSLREELLLEANCSILKRIKFFSCNFSEETLRKTMMIMKEKRFTPGDIIFQKGDIQESKLYIIKTGEIELLFGNSSHLKTVHTCKKGETFGEWAFFSGQEQKFSARSLDFTTTFAIDKNEFLSIIAKVNKDFEKFNEIKEKLILYNDPSPLHSRCVCCHSAHHKLEQCPIIHYCPKKQIVISRFLFNPSQERGDYKRRRKKCNSLVNRRINSKMVRLLQENIIKASSFFEFEDQSEEEEDEDEKNEFSEFSDSLGIFAEQKIQSIESLENQTKKSRNSNKSKITDKIKEEEISQCDAENEKSGFFSNYFPKNDVGLILKNIELRRINFLKKLYSRRVTSFPFLNPTFPHFGNIHNIDEAFVQGRNIKINQKTMVNFNEDQKRKGVFREKSRQLNLKKNFFKRIEESPEEINKYFRAKLRKTENSFKKNLKIALEKMKICFKNFLI